MQSSQRMFGLYLSLCLPFLAALFMDSLGFKFVAIATVIGVSLLIMLAPIKYSLTIALVFISFQGFFKIISNYHPIVHIGADLVVISLVVKVIFGRFLGVIPEVAQRPPLLPLFVAHFGWVLVMLVHPYSISFVSNIAGAKVYVSMILLYFFGFYLIKSRRDLHHFFYLFIILTIVHTLFAVYQGFLGPVSVLSVHPMYAKQLIKYYQTAFRPFGLTNLPGGPSVYIYTSLCFMAYGLFHFRGYFFRGIIFLSFPLVGLALMMCQVRSAIIKAIVSLVVFVFFQPLAAAATVRQSGKIFGVGVALALALLTIPYLMNKAVEDYGDNKRAFDRSLSSFDVDALKLARKNTWERFVMYAEKVPMGAGFARIGAAAGAFRSLHENDPYFPKGYFFSDNLFVALLIELGIPGLLIMSLLIGAIMWRGFINIRREKRGSLVPLQLALYGPLLAIFIGSYGAEGIIYNPESCFFWFFAGALMKVQSKDFPTGNS